MYVCVNSGINYVSDGVVHIELTGISPIPFDDGMVTSSEVELPLVQDEGVKVVSEGEF